jgi:hypothetical protein
MPEGGDRKDELGTEPGLAGGPGPTPPGVADGTPRILSDGSPAKPPPGAAGPRIEEVEDREGERIEPAEREGES